MTPVVQQAGEPRVRFECVLSELLARVDDDALVGRVQDAWAALLGSKRASEPTPDDLEWIADNIVAFGDFAKEAELLRNRAALDRALTSRLQAGEPTETVFLRLLNRWDMDAGYQLTDFIRDARALLASRPQQPQAATVIGETARRMYEFIKHGDEAHQAWLKQACLDFLANKPRPAPQQPQAETPLTETGFWLAPLELTEDMRREGFASANGREGARALWRAMRNKYLACTPVPATAPNTGAHPPEAEPALWQYRWLNPRGADVQPPEMTEWKELKPSMFGQTMQERIAEIRAFRYQGEPCYEVRALAASPLPPEAQEPKT